jgi:hypothetical protein
MCDRCGDLPTDRDTMFALAALLCAAMDAEHESIIELSAFRFERIREHPIKGYNT